MEDGIRTMRQSISKYWKRFQKTRLIIDPRESGKACILHREHFDFADIKMEESNELTAMELRAMLKTHFDGNLPNDFSLGHVVKNLDTYIRG